MPEQSTIRQHLEAIRDRHTGNTFPAFGYVYCAICERKDPCPDQRHAVAALDLLNNAERNHPASDLDEVPDPGRGA